MQNFISYKNAKISFSSKGSGKAIVFLHGFLENKTMWNSIVELYSTSYKIITIDLLGHGKSECLGYLHTMDEFAGSVEAVLKHLKIRRVILIGHSLGGYVSVAFAKKYPEKVKAICLMNSTAQADDEEKIQLRKRAIKLIQTNFDAMVRMSFANLFCSSSRVLFKEKVDKAIDEALKTPVQGYIAATEGMIVRENQIFFLQESDFKKYMIIGKKDPVLDFNSLQDECVSTNTKPYILDGGHMSHIENYEALVVCLKEIIREN